MASIRRFNKQGQRDAVSTLCLAAAGVDEGTNAATVKTTNAIAYSINGVIYSKAAEDNVSLSGAVIPDGSSGLFLVAVNAAGTVSFVQSESVVTGNALYLPDAVDGTAVIGAIKVATSGADFTPGTTDLSAAEVTATFYDLMCDNGEAF